MSFAVGRQGENSGAPNMASGAPPYPWILHPTIDLLLCCGGIFWLLIAALIFAGWHPALLNKSFLVAAVVSGSIFHHLLSDPHHPATLHRVYLARHGNAALRKKVTVLAFIALAVALSIYFVRDTSLLCIKLIVAWGIYHQLAQSYGVALIYCFKRQVRLDRWEKLIVGGLVNCCAVYLILRMFSAGPYSQTLVGGLTLKSWAFVPESLTASAQILTQLSILAFFAMVLRKYLKEKQWFPLPAMLTLLTLVIMPFVAGTSFSLVWVWFSTVFFHSSQYLVVATAFHIKDRGLPQNIGLKDVAKMLKTSVFLQYFGGLFACGFLLSYVLPNVLARGNADAAFIFAAVWAFLNVHHYASDGLTWKLRDPAIRELLVS